MSAITTFETAQADEIVKALMEWRTEFEADLREAIQPYGVKDLKDDVFALWFQQQVAASPLVVGTDPQGQPIGPIPAYVLVLKEVEGGEEILKRAIKLKQREMAMMQQPGVVAPSPPATPGGAPMMGMPG